MCSVVGDSEVHMKWCRRHFPAVTHMAVSCSELYFAPVAAMR